MDPVPAAEKKPVRVNIFNQTFTILTSDDPAEVEALAHTVDDLMRSYAKAGNIDTTRAAVLVCLHLADQLRTIQHDLDELKERVESKSRQFSLLLDQVIHDES